jgi:hypothetical protein
VSNARSLADLLYRRNKNPPKPESTPETSPPPTTDGPEEPRTQPIPLRPGEVVDLHMPEVRGQEFPFEAGQPLPLRGPQASAWSSVPLSAAVTDAAEDTAPTQTVSADQGPANQEPPARSDPPKEPSTIGVALAPASESYPHPAPAWPEPPRPAVLQDLRPRAPHLTQIPPVPPSSKPTAQTAPVRKDYTVSNIETILKEAMQIDGAIGVALVDYTSGMTLGQSGGGTLNLDVAAAGNTEVVRAKLRTMEALGLHDGIEDILITLSTQYHLIRLLNDRSGLGLFLYLALNKNKANLAMARHKLGLLERQIEI